MADLVILHDSPDFGGHERMLLTLLPGLWQGRPARDVLFRFPARNRRLHDALAALALPGLRLEPWPFEKRRAEPYLGPLRRRYAGAVRALVRQERPRTVLLVQGRIENLVVPMLALPKATRVVSYIPMAHRLAQMGRSGTIGDRVRRRLYRRPDRFIVPGETIAPQIAAAGGTAPVTVAANVVAMPAKPPQADARALLDLPADRRIALFLGRLEGGQKGLERLLAAIGRAGPTLADWTILFVGDGPEAAALARVAGSGTVDLRQVGWTDQPHLYLAAADLLLMPSRWEGVPLAMLEAMTYDVPVLGAPIDIFEESLPAECVIDLRTADLARAMAAAVTPDARARFRAAARRVLAGRTVEAARSAFVGAIDG